MAVTRLQLRLVSGREEAFRVIGAAAATEAEAVCLGDEGTPSVTLLELKKTQETRLFCN